MELNQRKMRCKVVATSSTKDSDEGALQESEEILVVGRRLVWLKIGSSFGSITKEDEIVWRNPLFEPPPCAFLTKKKEPKKKV
jgi:hypothetical protein